MNNFNNSFNFLYEWELKNPKPHSEIVNQDSYNLFRKSKLLKDRSINKIEKDEFKDILYNNIWEKYNLDNKEYPYSKILFNTFYDFNIITVERMLEKCGNNCKCFCLDRIIRRIRVLSVYEHHNQYNLLSLKKDYELKELCC